MGYAGSKDEQVLMQAEQTPLPEMVEKCISSQALSEAVQEEHRRLNTLNPRINKVELVTCTTMSWEIRPL
jgi:hypothetical protein